MAACSISVTEDKRGGDVTEEDEVEHSRMGYSFSIKLSDRGVDLRLGREATSIRNGYMRAWACVCFVRTLFAFYRHTKPRIIMPY